jgi:DNA-binding NarL/FixJ family response regulator
MGRNRINTLTDTDVSLMYRLGRGQEMAEMAEEFGVTQGAISMRFVRMRKKLNCKNNVQLSLRMLSGLGVPD